MNILHTNDQRSLYMFGTDDIFPRSFNPQLVEEPAGMELLLYYTVTRK